MNDTGARGHSNPTDVDVFNSLSSGKGNGLSSRRDGCFDCGGAHFQRDRDARKTGKGKHSKSWSKKSEGKDKSQENKGKSKGKSKGTKGAQGSHKGKTSKNCFSGLKNRNRRQARKLRNWDVSVPLTLPATMAGVLVNGIMTGVPLDGTKVGKKRMTLRQTHVH